MESATFNDRPFSSGGRTDQQLGQHQPTFSPPSKLAHSPKRPSPLRQCQIASIPDLSKISPIRPFLLDGSPTKKHSLRESPSAEYLRELRTNRAARLNGSRPPPPSRIASKRQRPSTSAGESILPASSPLPANEEPEPAQTDVIDYRAHSRTKSMDTAGRNNFAGRPLFPTPLTTRSSPVVPQVKRTLDRPDSGIAESPLEEREEMKGLRIAMDDINLDEEIRIHTAAQDEAAELVHKHRTGHVDNPASAYKNPDVFTDQPKKDYRAHLRTRSALPWNTPSPDSATPKKANDAAPSSSPLSREDARPSLIQTTVGQGLSDPFIEKVTSPRSSKGKSYEKLAGAVATDVAQARRRASSGNRRKISEGQKGAFPSADDKIFEEPDPQLKEARVAEAEKAAEKSQEKVEEVPRHVRRNPFVRVRLAQEKFEKFEGKSSPSGYSVKKFDKDDVSPNHSPASKPNTDKADGTAKLTSTTSSAKKLFDRSAEPSRPAPLKHTSSTRARAEKFEEQSNPTPSPRSRFDRIEIHRNPPSQSRKAGYVMNDPTPPTTPLATEETLEVDNGPAPPMKDGKEIRSDDIRIATSMKRKDRSTNLPQPTAVSDSPGRPIVSFTTNWGPKEIVMKEERVDGPPDQSSPLPEAANGLARPALSGRQHQSTFELHRQHKPSSSASSIPQISLPDRPLSSSGHRNFPTTSAAARPIPTISLPNPIPTINLPDDPVVPAIRLPEEPSLPTFSFPVESPTKPSRPLPTIQEPPSINVQEPSRPRTAPGVRPLPVPSRSSPTKPHPARPLPTTCNTSPLIGRGHVTPSLRRNTALCAHCALPIAGRVLSAAGERFHPACFKCHECSINLECVAFYPEPTQKRQERLDRISLREQGLDIPIPEGYTDEQMQNLEETDGEPSLRFFCHLDFHEKFSPRCKSCKTPIEGEVVVACGAEWHVGHFFCAQCGDPFDSNTPFVEKEGYAWCVGCHTNRYSAKCKRCKKPVTEVVVKALGTEWHVDCFTCNECNGQFEDGRYFLRGAEQNPVCVRCEDRRLKA